jgi:hypothetical protein
VPFLFLVRKRIHQIGRGEHREENADLTQSRARGGHVARGGRKGELARARGGAEGLFQKGSFPLRMEESLTFSLQQGRGET